MFVFEQIRVLELGRVFSGPLCGMLLADLGAEVIKIEKPHLGDESRSFGTGRGTGRSSYFDSLNRSKKSLTLNLKDTEDREILRKLIGISDVLVHNWIQGSLDNLGFSYEVVRRLNPRLIYCSISGYGYTSPYRDLPAQDVIAQSLSGLMSLTGEAEGLPMKTGIPVVDYSTGLYAAYAIMSALFAREKTGEGQLVHTSLLETAAAMTSFDAVRHLNTGVSPKRNGNRHPLICPYNVYETKDGLVTIAVANQGMWERFCTALNLRHLADDPAFSSNNLRLENQNRLELILAETIARHTNDSLMASLKMARVSCTRVNGLDEAFTSPELEALNIIIDCEGEEDISLVGKPFHLEKIADTKASTPPALGGHNEEILRLLGV